MRSNSQNETRPQPRPPHVLIRPPNRCGCLPTDWLPVPSAPIPPAFLTASPHPTLTGLRCPRANARLKGWVSRCAVGTSDSASIQIQWWSFIQALNKLRPVIRAPWLAVFSASGAMAVEGVGNGSKGRRRHAHPNEGFFPVSVFGKV